MKIVAVFITCLCIILPAPVNAAEKIAGTWSAIKRTKGGLGSQWIFFEDGGMSLTFGALVDFTYEIKDNFILMHMAEGEIVQEEFHISGNTLTIRSEASQEPQVMKRAGPTADSKQPLIGSWTYQHFLGKTAVMSYRQGGLAQLSVPFFAENGTYSIQDNQVVINLCNKDKSVFI